MTRPLDPYTPPHYPFKSLKDAQSFCEIVNKGEGCTYVEPIMYDGETWGVLKNEITARYELG